MRRLTDRRPTPAMAVAFVALLAALSGTAIALPGTNTVDSGDIKNNTIRSRDIRNNDVRTQDIRNGTVSGTDVRDDSLTGADILESSLGTVPSATSANTANSATTASNANALGGLGPAAYQKTGDLLFATVDTSATGATVVRGRGATAAGRLATGFYFVTFNRDVSNCTWVASAGRSIAAGTGPFIATPRGRTIGTPTPTDVGVVVWDPSVAGVPQIDGASFFLTVLC
jgi:hypothetical protein